MAKHNNPYGYELVMDLHGCDVSKFNRKSLEDYFKDSKFKNKCSNMKKIFKIWVNRIQIAIEKIFIIIFLFVIISEFIV